jgi:predicted transcriptional regulator
LAGEPDSRVALLAIHPRYAQAILAGDKRVEFRRASCQRATHLALYATAPVQRIVALCWIVNVERSAPSALWLRHSAAGGISIEDFTRYFQATEVGTAIAIGHVAALSRPLALADLDPSLSPPQSLRYLSVAAACQVARMAGESLGTPAQSARPRMADVAAEGAFRPARIPPQARRGMTAVRTRRPNRSITADASFVAGPSSSG